VSSVVSCVDNSSSKVEVIVYTTKSDKTLKQNMNAKDDTLRKRTSLIIVPQQVDVDVDVDLETKVDQTKARENGNGNPKRNSTASMDSCVSNTTSQSNQSSSGSHSGSSSTTSSGSSSGSEDAHAAYQDLQNGNAGQDHLDHHSPSPVPRCHSSSSSSSVSESTSCSSSVDYSLREQLKNFANRNVEDPKILRSSGAGGGGGAGAGVADPNVRLLKGMSLPVGDQQSSVTPALCDSLLSPQEVPLGRRYAEVAQFKGHPKAR